MQLGAEILGGQVKPRQGPRVWPGQAAGDHGRRPAGDGPAGRHHRLDEPRRPGSRSCPAISSPLAATPTCPFAAAQAHRPARFMACSSTPKSRTRRAANKSSTTSSTKSAVAPAHGPWAISSTNHRPDAPAGRRGTGDLRPVRRRRFIRRGGPAAQSHRRSTRLHLRGQRPAAKEREAAGGSDLPRSFQDQPARPRRRRAVPRRH